MSFSEKVKDELLLEKNKKCCILPLRYGELITESKDILIKELRNIVKNTCCKKALLKGIFLGSGCITDPNKENHFEILVKSKSYADFVNSLMLEFNLSPKIIKRGSNYVMYIKDSDQIATFLAVIGANKSVLEFENIRIQKSLTNNINREVNCETANLNKTIEASLKQLEAINKLKKKNKFQHLSSKLKEAADLRIKYKDASLDELVALANFKTSKSGLYHRLQKIIKIAGES